MQNGYAKIKLYPGSYVPLGCACYSFGQLPSKLTLLKECIKCTSNGLQKNLEGTESMIAKTEFCWEMLLWTCTFLIDMQSVILLLQDKMCLCSCCISGLAYGRVESIVI